jgi:GTP-sensing pleiotropic transcriptional regulator CodY
MDEVELTTFQVEVAHAFFDLKASEGYVVAGRRADRVGAD